jgi:hypothetical protein
MDRTRPIYCIGDSNVISYDRLAALDAKTKTFFACRSIHLRRFFYTDEVDPIHAKFHERMWAGLERNSLLSDDHVPTERNEPILMVVFSLGYWAGPTVELQDADFVIPNAPAGILSTLDPNKELIPYDLVVERVRAHQKPYIQELKQLSDCGFRDVFVLAMHPTHPDDEAFLKSFPGTGRQTTVAGRYKVLHVFNRLLAAAAAEVGVRCVDPFERLTVDGVLDLRFNLDNAHLNRAAARISIEDLIAQLT